MSVLKTVPIKQLNNKEVFPTNDDLRKWVFENTEQLEEALQTKFYSTIYNPDAPYHVRPDICIIDDITSDRVAIMMNLGNTFEREFFRYLTVAALNDVNRIVWIVTNLDNISYGILEWLSERTKGNVEFVVLRLNTYELPDSRIATKLERFERLPVPLRYEDLI